MNHIQNFSCLKSTNRAENRSLSITWKSNALLSIDPSTIKFFNFQLQSSCLIENELNQHILVLDFPAV